MYVTSTASLPLRMNTADQHRQHHHYLHYSVLPVPVTAAAAADHSNNRNRRKHDHHHQQVRQQRKHGKQHRQQQQQQQSNYSSAYTIHAWSKASMKYGFIYILLIQPFIVGIGLFNFLTTDQSQIRIYLPMTSSTSTSSTNALHYNDYYYCVVKFNWYLFGIYLIHDLILNIILGILFLHPLYEILYIYNFCCCWC